MVEVKPRRPNRDNPRQQDHPQPAMQAAQGFQGLGSGHRGVSVFDSLKSAQSAVLAIKIPMRPQHPRAGAHPRYPRIILA